MLLWASNGEDSSKDWKNQRIPFLSQVNKIVENNILEPEFAFSFAKIARIFLPMITKR